VSGSGSVGSGGVDSADDHYAESKRTSASERNPGARPPHRHRSNVLEAVLDADVGRGQTAFDGAATVHPLRSPRSVKLGRHRLSVVGYPSSGKRTVGSRRGIQAGRSPKRMSGRLDPRRCSDGRHRVPLRPHVAGCTDSGMSDMFKFQDHMFNEICLQSAWSYDVL
jgi:hypothetical protein